MPYANSEGQLSVRFSALIILCSSTYTTLSLDSISGQRRPRSACANAQADQGPALSANYIRAFLCIGHHMIKGPFSDVACLEKYGSDLCH